MRGDMALYQSYYWKGDQVNCEAVGRKRATMVSISKRDHKTETGRRTR